MTAFREDYLELETRDNLSNPVTVSFRDPDGRLIVTEGRAFRVVNGELHQQLKEFLSSPLFQQLVNARVLINTWLVEDPILQQQLARHAVSKSGVPLALEHEHIEFPSYPYEWPPEMLYAAGELTLNLMSMLGSESFGLKDATPDNVLFHGPKPIFVDLLSIERRDQRDPTWLAYAQFVRTFIRPLLASKYFGIRLDQIFRVYRDGLQPEHVFRMSSNWQRLRPLFLTSVSLPALLSRIHPNRYQGIYQPKRSKSPDEASFILGRQLRGLRRKLAAAKPAETQRSVWRDYESREQQSEAYAPAKQRFVEVAVREHKSAKVLDVGCNLGQFSLLAAAAGAFVVAIDQDPVVVGGLWRRAREANLNILPLVVDLSRPTPGLGWRNSETRGFLDRALGAFDCVFMLAVIHHMLVTERIPLKEILRLAWELTTDMFIVEFVSPEDPMFRLLTRGNDHLYQYLTRELFESACAEYFITERTEQLADCQRWIYQMRRRPTLA